MWQEGLAHIDIDETSPVGSNGSSMDVWPILKKNRCWANFSKFALKLGLGHGPGPFSKIEVL